MIVLSSIELTLDSPLSDPNTTYHKVLVIANIIFTAIFLLEAVMKTIAFGFALNGKLSYLRKSHNILDFIVVVFALLDLMLPT